MRFFGGSLQWGSDGICGHLLYQHTAYHLPGKGCDLQPGNSQGAWRAARVCIRGCHGRRAHLDSNQSLNFSSISYYPKDLQKRLTFSGCLCPHLQSHSIIFLILSMLSAVNTNIEQDKPALALQDLPPHPTPKQMLNKWTSLLAQWTQEMLWPKSPVGISWFLIQ